MTNKYPNRDVNVQPDGWARYVTNKYPNRDVNVQPDGWARCVANVRIF